MASPALPGLLASLATKKAFAQAHHDSTSQESVCAPMPGATTCNASTALYHRNVVADHDDLVHPTIIVKLYKNILYIYNN